MCRLCGRNRPCAATCLGETLALRDLFKKREQDEVFGTKILVACLGRKFAESASADARSYSRFYATPAEKIVEDTETLFRAVGAGYDVIHLFCDVAADGTISDDSGHKTPASLLIKMCSDSDVKLLWVASANNSDGYIKGFKPSGKPLNMVLTIDRRNSRFTDFLESLLRKMSAGETMPAAWVALVNQTPDDPRHHDAPICIFSAGRGAVRLR
jgi:hypothetical protein